MLISGEIHNFAIQAAGIQVKKSPVGSRRNKSPSALAKFPQLCPLEVVILVLRNFWFVQNLDRTMPSNVFFDLDQENQFIALADVASKVLAKVDRVQPPWVPLLHFLQDLPYWPVKRKHLVDEYRVDTNYNINFLTHNELGPGIKGEV